MPVSLQHGSFAEDGVTSEQDGNGDWGRRGKKGGGGGMSVVHSVAMILVLGGGLGGGLGGAGNRCQDERWVGFGDEDFAEQEFINIHLLEGTEGGVLVPRPNYLSIYIYR